MNKIIIFIFNSFPFIPIKRKSKKELVMLEDKFEGFTVPIRESTPSLP